MNKHILSSQLRRPWPGWGREREASSAAHMHTSLEAHYGEKGKRGREGRQGQGERGGGGKQQ